MLEFCGRSNKAGVFVVIAEYYGRARRGCVMIPVSSNRLGWSLFFTDAKPISMAEVSSKNGGSGGGQSTGGDRSGKHFFAYGH